MEKITRENNILTHAVCILIVVYSILRTYDINGIRISELIDYILIVAYLIEKRDVQAVSMPKGLKRYFLFWFISISVSAAWIGVNGLRPLFGWVHSYLLLALFFDKIEINILTKYYRYVAYACICFFFLQETTYLSTGIRIPGIIPGLHVMSEFGSESDLALHMQFSARSSSFFSEPAHFAQFLLPLLCIELFRIRDKSSIIRSGSIIITLLLTQTGNAIVGLAAISIVCLVKNMSDSNLGRKIVLTALTIVVSYGAMSYYFQSEKGLALLDRQDQLSMTDYQSGKSGFIRIYRGYYVYSNLTPIEKVIGVNDFETMRQRRNTSVVGYMFADNDNYYNAIQEILIRSGIIGLLIFSLFLFGMMKKTSYVSKASTICLIVMCFVSAIYLTPTMVLFLVIAEKLKSKENNTHLSYE